MQRTAGVVVSREVAEPFFEQRRERIPQLTEEEIFTKPSRCVRNRHCTIQLQPQTLLFRGKEDAELA